MPLGLARDSMVDLAELAHKHDEDEESGGSSSRIEYDADNEKVMRLSTGIVQDPMDDGEEKKLTAAEDEEDAAETDQASVDDKDSAFGSAGSITSDVATELSVTETSTGQAPSPSSTSYGKYSGFSTGYNEYEHYNDAAAYTAYAGTPILGEKKQQGLWCCLFPWMAANKGDDNSTAEGKESLVSVTDKVSNPLARSVSKDDDDVSTGSGVFGEKLSDKDRQAVLARLRLAQPDPSTTTMNGHASDGPDDTSSEKLKEGKGLLNGIVTSANPQEPNKLRGILKQSSNTSRQNLDKLNQNNSSKGEPKRRSLFPTYEEKKPSKNLKVDFSQMARVMTVKSQKDMDEIEKGEVWWQKSNYDEFRKTGRMITKAMLAGGSEIWLATNRSWQNQNQDRQATLKHAYSLAEQQAAFRKGDLRAKKEYEATRDKWWHKFGHSRRGLEHVASIDEGRQRQGNVKAAIKAVIDEQRRQRAFSREDAQKLRHVSIQHTFWARDLARAAGASDEDAVSKKFDEDNRRSREFYLLKFSRANQSSGNSAKKANVPAFMRPAVSLTVAPNRLDANTVAQIRYRQTQNKQLSTKHSESMLDESMAKKAAGYASGEEVTNMSAILTGMGTAAVNVGGP